MDLKPGKDFTKSPLLWRLLAMLLVAVALFAIGKGVQEGMRGEALWWWHVGVGMFALAVSIVPFMFASFFAEDKMDRVQRESTTANLIQNAPGRS
ncbi:hypothetical protein [Marinobacter sp. ELB17]|uniref:hypothetical protein n=1 Tax=Marinobacter sp. ELB17 TaxID=270374 RepID=UPI0000F36167|nr:hypothetical protein [Marinobacter sp. ELB17]EAZ97682.1 hypothetical protein MELB17_24157 [Marinobacter sp. ELB17]